MSAPKPLLLTALEPSADAIGAAFMRALKARAPETRFIGCGGPAMAAEGFKSLFPTDAFAVMGVADVASVFFKAMTSARSLADLAKSEQADAAVFIDGWSFSRLCATRFKKYAPETKLYKLAAPQVWASRPNRVDFVAEHFAGVMCLLPFEPRLFEAAGAKAAFVGNPNFQAAARARGDGAAFRMRHGLGQRPILTVLLGSRGGEVKRHAEVFGAVVDRMAKAVPNLAVVAPLAPAVEVLAREAIAAWGTAPFVPKTDEKYDAFSASTAALAASGTVTTELAINGAPMVVAYRVETLTALWLWRAMICDYASIVNIAADKEILPEFLQNRCTVDNIAPALQTLLTDEAARTAQQAAVQETLQYLDVDGDSAEARAAEQLLRWMAP